MKKQKSKKKDLLRKNAKRTASSAKDKRRTRDRALSLPPGVSDCRTPGARSRLARAMARAAGDSRRQTVSLVGIFHGTARGFGFLTPEKDNPAAGDIFIPAHATGQALDGDEVRVLCHAATSRQKGETRTTWEGEVAEVLTQGPRTAIGTLCLLHVPHPKGKRFPVFVPENPHLPPEIGIPFRDLPDEAEDGDKIEATLYHDRAGRLCARPTAVFGPAGDRGANYAAILAAHGVRTEFPDPVWREAEEKAAAPLTEEGRVRPREVIFTIDGADAKDLDDAISLRRLPGGGWVLSVHIADVSSYVTPGGALDEEAMLRGTSLYFTDRVVPMLPPALSNGACSLHPGEDKYALTAKMTLSPTGEILETTVFRSIIRSRVRGVYAEVNDLFLHGEASRFAPRYRQVMDSLFHMRDLYEVLARRARKRGALSFDRPEAAIRLNEQGDPVAVEVRERGIAEQMIEQFMLCANEGVATLLTQRGIPCIYRVHARPQDEKLTGFLQYAHNLGLSVHPGGAAAYSQMDLLALLREGEEAGLSRPLSFAMLRAMAKATYSEKAAGHFGLAIPFYCHFTSPIRRLSDLSTHRIIRAVLLDGGDPARYRTYAARAAAAAAAGELRALEAERDIEALYKTLFLAGQVGADAEATVSSCTNFGLFCELDNTCEGFVPIADLGVSPFFDEGTMTLHAGARTFRVGDRISIRIAEADIPRRRVRFSLLPPDA